MATDLWFEMLEAVTLAQTKHHPPVLFNAAITFLPFGPYEASAGVWAFRTGCRFEMADTALRQFHAVTTGSAFFYPAVGAEKAKIVLVRGDDLKAVGLKTTGILPTYFAAAPYFIYENVDPLTARQAAIDAFTASDRATWTAGQIKNADPLFQPASPAQLPAQLADLWMAGGLPCGLFMEGGEVLGSCDVNPAGPGFVLELRMAREIDPAPSVFFNPGFEFACWKDAGWLQGFTLFPHFTDLDAPVTANGVVHSISGGGSSQIADAIAIAAEGDTILLLDNQAYLDAIVVDMSTPVSVTSVAAADDYANYPTIDGDHDHRPVTITDVAAGGSPPSGAGVFVGKLIIKDGKGTGPRKDGGGVLVDHVNNAFISHCKIMNCEAPGIGAVQESILPAMGGHGPALFGEGFGGGVACYHASPGIYGCKIEHNEARGRGKGIGVFGYGWPVIFGSDIHHNGLNSTSGRKDGGGIGVQIAVPMLEDPMQLIATTKAQLPSRWDAEKLGAARETSVRIVDTDITSNNADDDGGGIYISVMSSVFMRNTKVLSNTAKSNGGGIRVTMGSRLITRQGCVIDSNQSNHGQVAMDVSGPGGGGLSVRNAELIDLSDTKIRSNTAFGWAGGGLSFLSSDEGTDATAQTFGITYDWNDILWDVYGYDGSELVIDGLCLFESNSATLLSGQNDHGKGGAIYALRFLGSRQSGFVLPSDKALNGKLKAPPIQVSIAATATVLGAGNSGTFANGDRLYLDDQTTISVIDDSSLSQAELAGTKDFSYP